MMGCRSSFAALRHRSTFVDERPDERPNDERDNSAANGRIQ
jgi:hypothetical protein